MRLKKWKWWNNFLKRVISPILSWHRSSFTTTSERVSHPEIPISQREDGTISNSYEKRYSRRKLSSRARVDCVKWGRSHRTIVQYILSNRFLSIKCTWTIYEDAMRHLNDRFEFRATVTEPVSLHERGKRVRNRGRSRIANYSQWKKSENDNCTRWRV